MAPFLTFQFAFDQCRERLHRTQLKPAITDFVSGWGNFVNQSVPTDHISNRRQHLAILYDIYCLMLSIRYRLLWLSRLRGLVLRNRRISGFLIPGATALPLDRLAANGSVGEFAS